MAQPFVFPPPPPPPPRKEPLYPVNSSQVRYSPSSGKSSTGRGASSVWSRGHGSAFRGRRGRGRGGPIQCEARHANLKFNPGLSGHDGNIRQLHNPPNSNYSSPTLGPKRSFSATFDKPTKQVSQPQAAPAVPSFGSDVLSFSPLTQATSPSVTRKKPRKHNQLGLTPASQDHESSCDEDEEAKLAGSTAANTELNSTLLQFEYRGQTAVLRSAADIAAWIAERRRNFPTSAKAEAAKREAQDRKKKLLESRMERAEAQRALKLEGQKAKQEQLRKRALESVAARRSSQAKEQEMYAVEGNDPGTDASLQVKPKAAPKLQQAMHFPKKAQPNGSDEASEPHSQETKDLMSRPLAKPDGITELTVELLADDGATLANQSESFSINSQSNVDSDDDGTAATSSSGSSAISFSERLKSGSEAECEPASDSDCSSVGSAPSEHTSKRERPDRVAPPPRLEPRAQSQLARGATIGSSHEVTASAAATHPGIHLCRNLLRTGRCHFGDRCRYSHDIPENMVVRRKTKRKAKMETKQSDRRGKRASLYQLLVEKEQEEEKREILRVIVDMGRAGLLNEEAEQGQKMDKSHS